MTRSAVRVALAVVFAVLADYLLYKHFPGYGFTIFLLALGVVLAVWYRRRLKRPALWSAVWLVAVAGTAIQPSAAGILVVGLLGWALLTMMKLPHGGTLAGSLWRGVLGGIRAFFSPLVETIERRALKAQAGRKPRPLWVVVVPSLILLVFALVMVPANLVLFTWVSDVADMLAQWFKGLTPPRVFLWLIVAAQVYGFTRWVAPGLLRMSSKVRVLPVPGDAWRANELRAALVTFVGLNLLYLAVNLTDAAYLLVGASASEEYHLRRICSRRLIPAHLRRRDGRRRDNGLLPRARPDFRDAAHYGPRLCVCRPERHCPRGRRPTAPASTLTRTASRAFASPRSFGWSSSLSASR